MDIFTLFFPFFFCQQETSMNIFIKLLYFNATNNNNSTLDLFKYGTLLKNLLNTF